MLATYQALSRIALSEFADIVVDTVLVGGTSLSPNKLRLVLVDRSYLDVWLSQDGDYAYHWEQRKQRGRLYRWDNAPHHPHVRTFPDHMHDGSEQALVESSLDPVPQAALRKILDFVRRHLESTDTDPRQHQP